MISLIFFTHVAVVAPEYNIYESKKDSKLKTDTVSFIIYKKYIYIFKIKLLFFFSFLIIYPI